MKNNVISINLPNAIEREVLLKQYTCTIREGGDTENIKESFFDNFKEEELSFMAEECCRYENAKELRKILNTDRTILYNSYNTILDCAVGSCNYEIVELVLSYFDKENPPVIRFKSSCDRANYLNENIDILLKENKVIFEDEVMANV